MPPARPPKLRRLALCGIACAALGFAAPAQPSGSLSVSATVRAFIPAEVTVTQARAVVAGPLPGGHTRSGAVGETPCLDVGPLAPGRYRLVALEGRVSTFAARRRFLFPDPDDGYRVPGDRELGGFQRYRVQVPRSAEFEVEVKTGERAVLGHIEVVRRPAHTWGVTVRRVPPTGAQTCQDPGSSATGSGATSSVRSPPPSGT